MTLRLLLLRICFAYEYDRNSQGTGEYQSLSEGWKSLCLKMCYPLLTLRNIQKWQSLMKPKLPMMDNRLNLKYRIIFSHAKLIIVGFIFKEKY